MPPPEALEFADKVPQARPEQPEPERLQVTPLFCASLFTIAANCFVPTPTCRLAVAGETATKIGGVEVVTVSVADPFTPAEVARIVELPTPTAVAKPLMLIAATTVSDDQVTELVRFCVEPSL